jgi:hypothetical protein
MLDTAPCCVVRLQIRLQKRTASSRLYRGDGSRIRDELSGVDSQTNSRVCGFPQPGWNGPIRSGEFWFLPSLPN